jgi:hypothetical protein
MRHIHETNPEHRVAQFGMKTATGPLRRHLFENHIDAWVDACDKMGIKIKAKEAQVPVQEYRQERPSQSESDRKPYSKEAFVDAIVEFIVGDDQVWHCSFAFMYLTVFISLSTSSSHQDCVPSF